LNIKTGFEESCDSGILKTEVNILKRYGVNVAPAGGDDWLVLKHTSYIREDYV